ncbi:M48 family metallopeptidase [Methylomarinum sp. Ch1-1]|uniref:M48 family metallopeptidase n=1 Tax=Methylomarinum roseum TaxID=3067653 RepID=A0AAU7NW43_9GAMM|nr:M48 family metallopeptidase [Methylomarinum sp. Ch1-1]MDP4522812.1 M48 family metallopeptidase [Methylomarinum sp. Ch1-1]
MIKFSAYYYDGRSSARMPVSVSFDEAGKVSVTGERFELETTLDQLSISARLGNTRRNIFLADGAMLETADNEALDRVCDYFAQNRAQTLLHTVEKNGPFVLLAFVFTVGFIWAGIEYAVPAAAAWVSKGVPGHVEQGIGEQGLETLDQWLFTDTKTDVVTQARLRRRFQQMTKNLDGDYRYRLLFRDSRQMGANALALPGGIIVVTDALLALAENEEQIIAVLAHEMGHVEYQHGLRSVLQDSLTALFMAGLLGDISSVSSLSVTLPTILVESRYSRAFEREADRFAVDFLNVRQVGVEPLIRILTLLERPSDPAVEFDYLSSHPAIDKRIAAIKSLQRQ